MSNQRGTPCSWCRGASVLNVGIGYFRDFDCDFGDGIGVCGGCGGIGIQFSDEAFLAVTREILNLRFQYCPTSGDSVCVPVRLRVLRLLIQKVSTLFQDRGDPTLRSFARFIAEGGLSEELEKLTTARDTFIDAIQKSAYEIDEWREAMLAFADGDVKVADDLFRRALEKSPESSVLAHDYGTFLVQTSSDINKALPWFIRSTTLQPKKALHFIQTAQCLISLERFVEARKCLEEALGCPDAEDEPELQKLSQKMGVDRSGSIVQS